MTREEQIRKAADDYCGDDTREQSPCFYAHIHNAFLEGVAWADSHPQWIPVEDELPPPHYEGANSTDFMLVYDGYDVMFGYYDFEQKNWHGDDYKEMMFDVTHWMPIVPPRKEE